MAEELNNTEVVKKVETVVAPEGTQPKEETFTKAQLEEIVKQRVAREKKASEKAIEEAKKLAKMNEDEKKAYEFEALQKELAELKRKDAQYGLSREASKMLSEQGIQADDELLQFVVKEDADTTKQSVSAFVSLINRKVEEGVKQALSGQAPRVSTNTGKGLTKDDILQEKDGVKRIKLIQENPHLFT